MKLCIFTFSPVQSFISQSRKLLDLFNSSFLLSYFTERLIEYIRNEGLGDVVYPVYAPDLKSTELAGYPNRIVIKSTQDLCERLREVFKKTWEDTYNHVILSLGLSAKERLQFEKHVDGYFESFCECKDFIDKKQWLETMELSQVEDAEDYGYTYDLVERFLGAKKSFRAYRGRVDEETYNEKFPDGCTLCGERPALAIDWESLRRKKKLLLSSGEKLCGVCLTKRFAMEYFGEVGRLDKKGFSSTKDFAWAPFKNRLIEDKRKDINRDVISRLEYLVGLVLGKESMPIEYISADWLDPKDVRTMMEEAEQEDRKHYEELLDFLEGVFYDKKITGYKKPENSYFGLLMMDGDNMGKWLGLKKELRKEKLSEDFHRRFSEGLSEYAKSVYRKAQEKKPCVELVYAGGDDVLAVGYPISLLSFAESIRGDFSKTLRLEKATTSAGLVVGHEGENLRFLLEELREAEKLAKREGRDRICISVVVRNSQPVRVVLKWNDLQLFKKITEYFKGSLVSQNMPYALREELWLFKEDADSYKPIVVSLLKRLFSRKSKLKKEEAIALIEDLEKAGFLKDLNSLEHLFYIARFFSKLEEEDEAVCV